MSIDVSSPPGTAPEWTPIAKLTPAAAASVDFTGLPVFAMYKLIGWWFDPNVVSPTLTINGDTTTIHYAGTVAGTASVSSAASSGLIIGAAGLTTGNCVEIEVQGLSPAVASGTIGIMGRSGGGTIANSTLFLGGTWLAGNAVQVNEIKISGTAMTGVFYVLGRN